MTALLAVLQVIITGLPEAEAIWPTISNLLSSGAAPSPADQATLWTAAAAIHARVQASVTPAKAVAAAATPTVAAAATPIG